MSNAVDTLLATSRVIVCAGSGGVGKTTTSAALAVRAAQAGRRVAVVTIDPAKRLADALGIAGQLSNDPKRISLDAPGELWAMMLDTRTTFDALITRYSPDAEQAERITANRFYKNISGALSGTQEYMAAEKLFELYGDTRFDLVVVDTPPTRQALDFLSAPARLTRFIDHPLYRIVIAPTNAGLRVVNTVTQPVLRAIARVVGAQALDDALAFFRAFQGLDAGFRDRAVEVERVLHDPSCKYMVVASPQRDTVAEACFFIEELRRQRVDASLVVVNRMQPRFGTLTSADATTNGSLATTNKDPEVAAMWANLADLLETAELQEKSLEVLTESAGSTPLARVPLLPELLAAGPTSLATLGMLGSLVNIAD